MKTVDCSVNFKVLADSLFSRPFPSAFPFPQAFPPPSPVMQLAIPMWHWASLSASFWEASATCDCLTLNRPVKNMDSDVLYSFFDPVIHRIGSGSQPYVNKICSQSFVYVCRVQTSLVQKEDSLHDNLIRCFFNPSLFPFSARKRYLPPRLIRWARLHCLSL